MPKESNNKLFIRYGNKADQSGIKRNSKESLDWYRNIIRKDRAEFEGVQEKLRSPSRLEPGTMITYEYDPKFKKTLPFYDTYPLIIVLEVTRDGWYGANVHYLPPRMRQELFESLNYRRSNAQRIARSLENNEITKHCLKRYLSNHLRSKPKLIPKTQWDIAIYLPYEGFVKASRNAVWRRAK